MIPQNHFYYKFGTGYIYTYIYLYIYIYICMCISTYFIINIILIIGSI
ncbi:MAG: hypothetical protein N7Q72_04555 [Spiroplasma sp. Tabriz.8]|nr:hypothetical protein [Spiroplasma sp. Tabriz.8]